MWSGLIKVQGCRTREPANQFITHDLKKKEVNGFLSNYYIVYHRDINVAVSLFLLCKFAVVVQVHQVLANSDTELDLVRSELYKYLL